MEAERAAVRIFDLIDAGRIAEAEGALETALSRHPQSNCVLAAQALLLLRSGQPMKARVCAEQLAEKNVEEPKAINALVHVLQQTCSWAALVRTYERLRPRQDDRNTSENLLQTYVRMGNYKAAQTVAMQLYREYKDPKYQVWVVQACLGQVPPDSKDDICLKVAARILDTSVLTEAGMLKPTTVRAYVDVLMQQELYDDAVLFLCTERGAKIGLLETRLEVLANVLKAQGKLAQANAVAKFQWRLHPDNWTPFDLYMQTITAETDNTVLHLLSDTAELRATVDCSTASTSLEGALALARELQEAEMTSAKPQRGPFMAELALLKRKGSAAGLEDALLAYAHRFYRTPCCYLDLSTFLTPTTADRIAAWTHAEAALPDSASPADQLLWHKRRTLGLRCRVASWGDSVDTQPSSDAMMEIIDSCQVAYETAKPLSTFLAWSEEGYCDAYLNIALNVAFHAYHAHAKDPQWLVTGLELMHAADRRMNNPSWLILSVCFASHLGLVDRAALNQLAFKSVQCDTMSHLGYWPLVRGLAKEDAEKWNRMAMSYYRQVTRDCSLLRAQVFTYTSWPAIRDVNHFDEQAANSLTRWLVAPHWAAESLRQCQTQQNIFKLLEESADDLWEACEALAREDLVDNTDWLVTKSNILGHIRGEKVNRLTDALVQMPSPAWRLTHGRQLVHSMLVLHDVATIERHRQHAAKAPKARRKKDAIAAVPKPNLYTPRLLSNSGSATLECLPALEPLVPSLVAFTTVAGADTVPEDGSAEVLSAYLDGLVQAPTPAAWEEAMRHEVYILAALVRVGTLTKLPVKMWAAALLAAVLTAQAKYTSREWRMTQAVLPAGGFVDAMAQDKQRRLAVYMSELVADVSASSQRKA